MNGRGPAARRAAGRVVLLLVLAVTLAGCFETSRMRVTPEHALFIKTAAVVNFVDPWPRLHATGIEVRDNHDHELRLKGWAIDRVVTDLLEARLRQKGFEVRTLGSEREITPYDNDWSRPDGERILSDLVALGEANDVDLLVVVYRDVVDDFMEDSIDNVRGYGLYRRRDLPPHAYAAVRIEAVNVRRGSIIGRSSAQASEPLDPALWPPLPTDRRERVIPSAELQAKLLPVLRELVHGATLIAAQEAGVSN